MSSYKFKRHTQKIALGIILVLFTAGFVSSAPLRIRICEVQGASFSSSYEGAVVQVRGIVTADLDQTSQKGFYLQDPECDAKATTSNGIFISLPEKIDLVQSGDRVQVIGHVQENYGMTEIVASQEDIVILSQSNQLPNPRELDPPYENSSGRYYFETLEGMLVSLSASQVVGPTDSNDRTWVVRSDLNLQRVFNDDPAGTGEVICVDDGGLYEIAPQARTGDQVFSMLGVLDYRLGVYCLQLVSEPILQLNSADKNILVHTCADLGKVRLATFNLEELFDTVDDPVTEDLVLSQTEYQRRLQKHALAIGKVMRYPALLAVQEVENLKTLRDLLGRPEVQFGYSVVLENGPDVRGLDVALLYRPDLVSLIESHSYQGCTNLVDGFEPDGNNDPQNPVNEQTCDSDGDGILDGNRLFSRPPLTAHLWVRPEMDATQAAAGLQSAGFHDIWVIAVHFKSKVGDGFTTEYTLPRRIEQAQFVVGLLNNIRRENPNSHLLVLGDFNDFPDSQPLTLLKGDSLLSAAELQDHSTRYTYIYQGISQQLDDILFSPSFYLVPVDSHAEHINADYPWSESNVSGSPLRSSDHDPLILELMSTSPSAYFPVVRR